MKLQRSGIVQLYSPMSVLRIVSIVEESDGKALSEVETNCHVMSCQAYEQVRQGLDLDSDTELVQFFKKVMKIRMEKKTV